MRMSRLWRGAAQWMGALQYKMIAHGGITEAAPRIIRGYFAVQGHLAMKGTAQ